MTMWCGCPRAASRLPTSSRNQEQEKIDWHRHSCLCGFCYRDCDRACLEDYKATQRTLHKAQGKESLCHLGVYLLARSLLLAR